MFNINKEINKLYLSNLSFYLVYSANYLFSLGQIDAVKFLDVHYFNAPCVLISIWLWHFILHQQ